MYEFKLRIHVSGWLILALIVAFLLWSFVPVVSAADNPTMIYNGIELPNIDSVWLLSVYPYAYIYSTSSTPYLLVFTQFPQYYENDTGSTFRTLTIGKWASYVLSSSGDSWVESVSSNDDSLVTTGGATVVWSFTNIFRCAKSGSSWVATNDLYFSASNPVVPDSPGDSDPTGATLPVFTVEPPLVPWVEYNVGDDAVSIMVAAVAGDGGTVTYTWYRIIYNESGTPSNVVFSTGPTLVPDTSVVSDSSYYCVATNTNGEFSQSAYSRAYRVKVVESGAADPPSETPTYPSAEDIGSSVGDAFQDVLDQNDINTSEQGNSFVDQITQIVPNESQGFVAAMGGLVDSLSYGGTECVLTVPALVMPQIGDLVPQYTLLEKQTVDLESYFNMFPAFIVTLVQSLFTVALIVFCFKELYSTVSYFFVLRGGET